MKNVTLVVLLATIALTTSACLPPKNGGQGGGETRAIPDFQQQGEMQLYEPVEKRRTRYSDTTSRSLNSHIQATRSYEDDLATCNGEYQFKGGPDRDNYNLNECMRAFGHHSAFGAWLWGWGH